MVSTETSARRAASSTRISASTRAPDAVPMGADSRSSCSRGSGSGGSGARHRVVGPGLAQLALSAAGLLGVVADEHDEQRGDREREVGARLGRDVVLGPRPEGVEEQGYQDVVEELAEEQRCRDALGAVVDD